MTLFLPWHNVSKIHAHAITMQHCCNRTCQDGGGANANNKKTRPPHGDLASSLLLVEYLFCLYWKVTYEKVFCYYLLSISCYS